MKHVTIIMGSDSDKNIADKAVSILEKFKVPYSLVQASAHREPEKVKKIAQQAQSDVFICIAGLAAALPGVVASLTSKPVIGVPKNVRLGGLDALLSIVQMPSGIPVGTVGIDNGKNAAYQAIRILGLKYPEVLTGESSSTESSIVSNTIPAVKDNNSESGSIKIPGLSESSESSGSSVIPGVSGLESSDSSSSNSDEGKFPGGMMGMFNQESSDTGSSAKKEKKPKGDWL
ncbi:MAG: 5-(carboxyamino)imidazole ribonucleotide mutase [Candidatus Undinarchaeales archaeon]